MKSVLTILLAAVMFTPALADDDKAEKKAKGKGKGRTANPGAQIIKQLGDVELTDDQKAKIAELGKALAAQRKEILTAAGVTPELQKKRQEAMKSLKESGKKGKELQAAINEKAGYTKDHAAAVAKANQLRGALIKDVVALLSDEQKAKLPKAFNRGAGGRKKGAGKAAGEKKGAAKKAAAEKASK